MSRIKGRYVAQVILTVDEERTEDMMPIEVIKENFAGITEEIKKELAEKLGHIIDDDDDDDEEDDERENCEECENNRWCPLPDAIAYRKKNHIPAPKKRKNGKRGGKKNEKVN